MSADAIRDALRGVVAALATLEGACDASGCVVLEGWDGLPSVADLAAQVAEVEPGGCPQPDGQGYSQPVPKVVSEVVEFEVLPIDARGSRRVIVRWSDGSVGEALRWYDDEVLVSEGDVLGKTQTELQQLLGRRDRDWLRGD